MTRLIDADELKAQIPTIEDEYKYVHKLIDSAPTVNFTISPDYVTELQNSNKELIKQLEEAKRPQGDLISREALKKVLIEEYEAREHYSGEIMLKVIDNAPAVDLKDIYQEGHYDGHLEGYIKAINEERPQCNQIAWEQGYEAGLAQGKQDRPQGDLADEVWKLSEKYHSHLATNVIEFGNELKDLLGKYKKGSAE